MTFQGSVTNKSFTDNKFKNRNPCDFNPPCNNCKTMELSPDWICEDVYVPEIKYEPIRPTLLCCEKPKKKFWQQWLGEKYFSLKNKCSCKTNKKAKCKVDREFSCQPVHEIDPCNLPPRTTSDKTTALCKTDARCPTKVCAPPSNGICGCRFYFNIGKLPRRKKAHGNSDDLHNPSMHLANNPNNVRPSLRSQSPTAKLDGGGGGRVSFKVTDRRRSSGTDRRRSSGTDHRRSCKGEADGYKYTACRRVSKKEFDDGIRIGVTLTKEETKYCKDNTTFQGKRNGNDIRNQENDSSDQILTLEIHKSGTKINQIKNENYTSKVSESENNAENEIKPSFVPQSESYMQEVEPMLQMKRRISDKSPINEYNVNRTSQNISPQDYLDRRVSEILRKLEDIEKKMCVLERKNAKCNENKNIKIDIDGQKSTVSVHLRDGLNNNNNGYTNNGNSQSDDVIEIKQKNLKSQSPCRDSYDHSQVKSHNDPCSNNYENNNQGKHKIVIKLPNDNNSTRINRFSHTIQPTEIQMCTTKPDEQSDFKTTWCHIANNLKMNTDGNCYCVTCFSRNSKCC